MKQSSGMAISSPLFAIAIAIAATTSLPLTIFLLIIVCIASGLEMALPYLAAKYGSNTNQEN